MFEVPFRPKTYEFGRAFEHFLILEFFKLCQYRERDESLYYLQTKDNVEVDLIVKRPGKNQLFIEIKSTDRLTNKDFTALTKISAGLKDVDAYVLSLDLHQKSVAHVRAFHWQKFLSLFQNDKI